MRGFGRFIAPKHDVPHRSLEHHGSTISESDGPDGPDAAALLAVHTSDFHDGDATLHTKTPRTVTAAGQLDVEEAEILYEEIQEAAVELEDLPEDVWSVLLYCMIQDLPDIVEGKADWQDFVRFPYGLGCAVINMLLQFTFIYWIAKFVSLPSVRAAQDAYRRFHAEAFKYGRLDEVAFDELGDFKDDICGLVLSNYSFLFAVLFLWLALCWSELKGVLRSATMLSRLPDLPPGLSASKMYVEGEEGECDKLFALTPHFRKAIWILTLIPQATIVIAVALFGCVWLTATSSFADLILNSLALGFVARIDDLLFNALLPEILTNKLIYMKCAMPPIRIDQATDFRNQYRNSALTVVCLVIIVAVFLQFQPVLPNFAWDLGGQCARIHIKDDTPWCSAWQQDCFPT